MPLKSSVVRGVVGLAALTLMFSGTAGGAAVASDSVGEPEWLGVAAVTPYAKCDSVPYNVDRFVEWGRGEAQRLAGAQGKQSFDLRVEVRNPRGNVADTDIVGLRTDSTLIPFGRARSFTLCAGPGKYVATVQGEWCPTSPLLVGESAEGCKRVSFRKSFVLKASRTSVALRRDGGNRDKVRAKKVTYVIVAKALSGKKAVPLRNSKVALQQRVNGRWKTISSGKTGARGKFTTTIKIPSSGSYTFRARVLPSAHVKSTASKGRSVRVTVPKPKPSYDPPSYDFPSYDPPSYNPPGYNGPRCYAPGGETWTPC